MCLFILDVVNGLPYFVESGEFEGLGLPWRELAFEGLQATREGRWSRRQRHRVKKNYDINIGEGEEDRLIIITMLLYAQEPGESDHVKTPAQPRSLIPQLVAAALSLPSALSKLHEGQLIRQVQISLTRCIISDGIEA